MQFLIIISKKPPFGETKKKDEFPDAFVLAALEGWCEKNNERIYVASTDPDLKLFCETNQNLFYIKRLVNSLTLSLFTIRLWHH